MSTLNERLAKAQIIWNATATASITPEMEGRLLYETNFHKLETDNSNAVYETATENHTKVAVINPTTKKWALEDKGVSEEFVNQAISTAIANIPDNRLEFPTYADFPSTGDENKFYVDLEEDKIYIWDSSSGTYKVQSWDTYTISQIQTSLSSAAMAIYNLDQSKLNNPSSDGTYIVKKVGGTISYEAFSGGGSNTFTELISNSWDGTNKYKTLTANASITLSTELVNGYILLTQDNTGNRTVTINGISIPIKSTAQYSSLVGYAKINGVYYFSINSNLLQQPPIVVSPSFLTFTIKDSEVTGSNGNYSISAGYKFAVSDEFATNEGYVIWENTTTGLVVVGLDVEKTIENFYNASNVGQWNTFAYIYNGIIYANEIGRTYDQQVNLGSSTGITHLRIRRTATNIILEKSTDGGNVFTVIHTYIGFTTSNLYVKFGTASIAPSTINGLKKLFV